MEELDSFHNIGCRLKQVRNEILRACASCGRSYESVRLIGVSKFKSVQDIDCALRSGLADFGENYAQELKEKCKNIEGIHWHFIGHLQKNKVNDVVSVIDYIHSLDSLELIERVERICLARNKKIKGFLQVHLGGEESKGGIEPQNLLDFCLDLSKVKLNNLSIVGLMTIPPPCNNAEDNRHYFRLLRELKEEVAAKKFAFWRGNELSMGMSGDFSVAIEEGATFVRLGRAIFGERHA